MPISAPPTIPQITDPSTFATRAQDWVVWQANELYPAIEDSATILTLSTSSTSTTSNTIGLGAKTFTVQTGKGYLAGQSLSIAYTTTPTNRMFAVVTSYDIATGELVVNVQAVEGSGTYTEWSIALAFNGVISTGQIADDAVTTPKIADSNVTLAKLEAAAKTDKIQPITASVASSELTITLNPTVLDFRDSTLTSGAVNTRLVDSAISCVVPSTATLGTVNAVQNRLAVLAIDNAGTVELAVVNLAGGNSLDETGVITTTALSTASDSNNVIYSTTARTDVPYRVVGYVESTQATAGTWATAPSTIQGYGGLSFQHMNKILNGVSVTASGTSVDFTGIPSWVKRITVMLNQISTNGTSLVQVQLGAGSITTSGYLSSASTNGANSSSTTGLLIGGYTGAVDARNGILTITNITGNSWVMGGSIGSQSVSNCFSTCGTISLSGILDRLRLTTANGTDVFDAGSINILYE